MSEGLAEMMESGERNKSIFRFLLIFICFFFFGGGLGMVGYNFNFSLVVTHALKSLRWTLQNAWKMEKVEG